MVLLAAVTLFAPGCASAVRERRVIPPGQIRSALEATREQLIERYNQQARAVRSVNAAVELVPVAGSTYSGVIEEYHDVRGFVLAAKPAHIRMIGQAPVVAKNVFDMVSDGETFRIFIPPKNKFIVGPAGLERPTVKPIENLRPQHLLDALFWPEIDPREQVIFEEFNSDAWRYYILTVVRGLSRLETVRKIWFDRADLSLARLQLYAPGGRLVSDIRYADWQAAAGAAAGPVPKESAQSAKQSEPALRESARDEMRYPLHIWLERPRDDYRLEVRITRLALNEEIAADRFRLEQPAGTDLVRVGDADAGVRP